MAQIKYPVEFIKRTDLFYSIDKKNTKDGDKSVLIPFLTEKEIDMAADKTTTDKAVAQHKEFEKLSKQSEDYTQLRKNTFTPVFNNLNKEVQYLKSLYRGNPKELGNWGITIDGTGTVVYPPSFEDKYDVFILFYQKHKEMGDKSPLIPFLNENNINIDKDKTKADKADELNNQKIVAELSSKEASNERDILFEPIMEHIRGIGQFLKRLFPTNPRKIGDWGFNVVGKNNNGEEEEMKTPPKQ